MTNEPEKFADWLTTEKLDNLRHETCMPLLQEMRQDASAMLANPVLTDDGRAAVRRLRADIDIMIDYVVP